MSQHRLDIQTLRGWAVAIVVIDHAGLSLFPGGFLGVDIFFVISGFLITSIITRDLAAGTFSFRDFYLKRARRILPAAYATMILTSVGAIWFMTSIEFRDLEAQIIGGVTFTINLVLMGQADYFAPEADTKPLLHLWSLAIEEQFYLLLPAILFYARPTWRRGTVVSLCALSSAACVVLVARGDLTPAFYLLPTRAWELLIGAMTAVYWTSLVRQNHLWNWLFWPATVGLVLVPVFTFGAHPGPQALLICLCTAVVILANKPLLGRLTLLRYLGDMSYSLYLVHWPIAVFAFSSHYGVTTLEFKLTIVGLSFAVAVAMYTLVERPARAHFNAPTWQSAAAFVAGAVAVIGSYTVATARSPGLSDFADIRRTNYGLSKKCNFWNKPFAPTKECATADSPEVLVWGDSFAMHLIDGLVAVGLPLRQATLSACAPIIGQAPLDPGKYDETWARNCIAFNDDVLSHIESSRYRVVLIASPWGTMTQYPAYIRATKGRYRASLTDLESSLNALRATVGRIRASGAQVIIVEPPPSAGKQFNLSTCAERILTGKLLIGSHGCTFARADYEIRANAPLTFVSRAETEIGIPVLRTSTVICDETTCNGMIDGTAMFRDTSHLSKDGSRLVMERVGLSDLLNGMDVTSLR